MRRSVKKEKKKLHYTRFWKRLVLISILLMFATIILDLFYRNELETKGLTIAIDIIDIPVSLVLIADVYLKFNDAKDKKKFAKSNIVLIVSILPISIFLMGFRLLRMFPVLAELPLLGELVALERAMKLQHGAKFIEGLKELVGFK